MLMGDDPCRILIVEDEEAHAELIRRAFALRGAVKGLTVARTLTEARAYLARSRPDLVIADLLLPDGKGTDLLDGDDASVAYPLMVLTAHGDEQAAVDAMKAGALDYIVKSDATFADMPRIADRALRQWQHITERQRAEERAAAYRDRLRSLAVELVRAEDRERRRLAAFVHDVIAQKLVLAGIRLDELRGSGASTDVADGLAEVSRLLSEVVDDSRSVMFDLSPPTLYELGFVEAAQWLAEEFEPKHGVTVDFKDDGRPKPLAKDMRAMLFRAVRELLVNVVKHARAGRVRVSVAREGSTIRVTVADDGVGFDVSAIHPPTGQMERFGLFSIRERLDYLGGRLQIESQPGRGTRVTLTAPLEHGDLPMHEGTP